MDDATIINVINKFKKFFFLFKLEKFFTITIKLNSIKNTINLNSTFSNFFTK